MQKLLPRHVEIIEMIDEEVLLGLSKLKNTVFPSPPPRPDESLPPSPSSMNLEFTCACKQRWLIAHCQHEYVMYLFHHY